MRPNGSTGWIKATDVRLTEHDYRMTIRLTRPPPHRDAGASGVILTAPIGVGTATTPTPGGLYYTKELLRPPRPDGVYGPYAYGLSGFSNELTTFDGGDGVIGIHGTNDPAGLGKDVSHGCIRMPNADILKLVEQVKLPLGVPVAGHRLTTSPAGVARIFPLFASFLVTSGVIGVPSTTVCGELGLQASGATSKGGGEPCARTSHCSRSGHWRSAASSS